MSYRIEWISKPFGVWSIINSQVKSQVATTCQKLESWYPMRVNEWLDHQKTSEKTESILPDKEENILFESNLEQVKVEMESINLYMVQLQTWIGQIPTEYALVALVGLLMLGLLLRRYFYLQQVREEIQIRDSLMLINKGDEPNSDWNSTI